MQVEQQVCSFEQAKRLKELGIKADTHFVWFEAAEYDKDGCKLIKWHPVLFYEHQHDYFGFGHNEAMQDDDGEFNETRGNYPAFTVAELGLMLPDLISTNRQYELVLVKEEDCWLVMYVAGNDMCNTLYKKAETTEAQARAAMLIYLLESKIITTEEVNHRLLNHKESVL